MSQSYLTLITFSMTLSSLVPYKYFLCPSDYLTIGALFFPIASRPRSPGHFFQLSIPPVPPDLPTGSVSFSVSPSVAPQLLCTMSWVTWINDNSSSFTEKALRLHKPGNSAANPVFLPFNPEYLLRMTLFTFFSHCQCLYHSIQQLLQQVYKHIIYLLRQHKKA